ncbi:MAG: hypothetical protein PHX65_03325 [Sulfurimonas sp.]|jgi:hypothetical protein|nr:hypothetical protein [Sulfurimonas sp.]
MLEYLFGKNSLLLEVESKYRGVVCLAEYTIDELTHTNLSSRKL